MPRILVRVSLCRVSVSSVWAMADLVCACCCRVCSQCLACRRDNPFAVFLAQPFVLADALVNELEVLLGRGTNAVHGTAQLFFRQGIEKPFHCGNQNRQLLGGGHGVTLGLAQGGANGSATGEAGAGGVVQAC